MTEASVIMAKSVTIPELTDVPVHVGVIMDGNGRWAKKRGLPRKFGHREGVKVFRSITRRAKALGIKYITFYAFSTENWKRPKDEVDAIMELFEKNLDEVKDFIDEEIRVRFIGDRSALSPTLQAKMLNTEKSSEHFIGTTMILAINYGGQDEICRAAVKAAGDIGLRVLIKKFAIDARYQLPFSGEHSFVENMTDAIKFKSNPSMFTFTLAYSIL